MPTQPPPGTLLAIIDLAHGYSVTQSEVGYVVRFNACCDFELDRALTRIDVHPAPDCSREFAALLLTGAVLASLLTLQKRCVLHASAVSMMGRQWAFIGPSCRGKSTFAAALCREGAALIADDVLRCDCESEGVVCYSGAQHIRLRETAMALAPNGQDAGSLRTVDGRLIMTPLLSTEEVLPLNGLIVPRTVERDSMELTQIAGAEALTELARSSRITSWSAPNMRRQQFELLGALAQRVPVFALTAPRGAIFEIEGRRRLVDALGHLVLAD